MSEPCRKIDVLGNPVVRRKASVEAAGLTATEIGRRLEIDRSAVTLEINGFRKSYLIRAAITVMTGQDHAWLWGEDAPAPTAEQAESLARRLGVRFCARDRVRPYKLVTQCWNCGHADGCAAGKNGSRIEGE